MVNSQVPKVIINSDGDIDITVQVVGFEHGKSVEVYGYVTQDSGYFASFRETRDFVPDPTTGVAKTQVTVSSDKLKLAEGVPVTVVTSVSEIWPSMLTSDPQDSTTGVSKPSWTVNDELTPPW